MKQTGRLAKQVADIEDLLTSKVDALIILPINPDLVAAQVAAAKQAGIPVVVYIPEGMKVDADISIAGGGQFFGKVGGEFLAKELGGKGTVGIPRRGRQC